jgi:CHAP domain
MISTLDVALSQLGISEKTNNNDGIPAERYMRGDKLAWCAGLMLWCNDNSDNEKIATNDKLYYHLRSVQNFEDHMKSLNRWASRAEGGQPNWFIFFQKRGESDKGVGRHMGIVEKVENGFVHTIEGNSSNMVRRRKYQINDPYITGYGKQS